MNGGELRQLFREVLEPVGFRRRRGKTWRRESTESVQIVDLDKDPAVPGRFWLALGVWIRDIGEEASLEHYGHVRIPADALAPTALPRIDVLLWLDEPIREIDELDRPRLIADFLREHVIPFLDAAQAIEGLKRFYDDGLFKRALVQKDVRQLLDPDWVPEV